MKVMTTDFKITIDERIHRDERLLQDVRKATDFFIEQYEPRTPSDPPFVPEIEWTLSPGVLPPLWVNVHEKYDLGLLGTARGMMMNDLRDERSRNVNMLKLWGQLLDERSGKRITLMEDLLRQLEEEQGVNSGNHVSD
jgi:hypothetical protein